MKYNLEKKENGIFDAVVSVDKAEWDKALDSSYEKNKGKYNIPGFRKGHAPRNMIEKTYGAGAFVNDAIDEIYYQAYTLVLKEHSEIQPIDSPKLDIKKFDDTGVDMVLSIPCVPDFTLAQYKGLTFTRQEVKVSDKEIEDAIQRELLRGSRLVETGKAIKNDDYVNLDFDGYVDGKQFDGGKAENYQLQIGSHTFIDTFEEQLVGLNIGDKKDVLVTFPAEYHEKTLAGKPATFKVEIKNIRERIMPELNEEFVSNSTEYETVEEFKKSIEDRLVKQANDRADIELDNDILDKIVDDTELVVPESLAEQEYSRQLQGMEYQMKYQGITIEDYAKYMGKTVEEFKSDIKNSATRNVKARLVLEKLIREEKLDITDADIDNKIAEMAKNVGKDVEEYKKQVNNDMVNRVANELLMKKLINFLHENNSIK
ncbi:MAG: trigger factor [Clostridiales bacterium]|nr:trigger factor [Clostridiales bacterium]